MSEIAPSAPIERSPFDRWLWENNISNVEAGKRLGRHPLTIGRWRKPLSDPARRIPDQEGMKAISRMTGGELGPPDFYEPNPVRETGATEAAERV